MNTETLESPTVAEANRSPLAGYSVERIYACVMDAMNERADVDSCTFTDNLPPWHGAIERAGEDDDEWHTRLIDTMYAAGFGGLRSLNMRAPWVQDELRKRWLASLAEVKDLTPEEPHGIAELEATVGLGVAIGLFELFATAGAMQA